MTGQLTEMLLADPSAYITLRRQGNFILARFTKLTEYEIVGDNIVDALRRLDELAPFVATDTQAEPVRFPPVPEVEVEWVEAQLRVDRDPEPPDTLTEDEEPRDPTEAES